MRYILGCMLIGLVFFLGCAEESAPTNVAPGIDAGPLEPDPGPGPRRGLGEGIADADLTPDLTPVHVAPDAGIAMDLSPAIAFDALAIPVVDAVAFAIDTLSVVVPDALPVVVSDTMPVASDTRPALPVVSDAGPPCEPNAEEVARKKTQQAATKALLEGKTIRQTLAGNAPKRYVYKNDEIAYTTLHPVTLQPTTLAWSEVACGAACIQETRCYLACPLDTMWVSVLSGDKKTTVCVGPYLDCEYACHGGKIRAADFYSDLARGTLVIE